MSLDDRFGRVSFEGPRVWIIGASSGIGAALAHEMSRCGARLILSARREAALQECSQSLLQPAAILPLDLSDTKRLPEKADWAERNFGPIDVLVNCAGISQRAKALETEPFV